MVSGEGDLWDIELNTRREIPYLDTHVLFSIFNFTAALITAMINHVFMKNTDLRFPSWLAGLKTLRFCLCKLRPHFQLYIVNLADQRAYASQFFSVFGCIVNGKYAICDNRYGHKLLFCWDGGNRQLGAIVVHEGTWQRDGRETCDVTWLRSAFALALSDKVFFFF